jgi:PAS domain S-box-containing protein
MKTGFFSLSNFTFNPHAVPPLLTAFAVLLLGTIVVVREKRSRVSLLYLIYTVAVFAWLFSASTALLLSSEARAFEWMKVASAGVMMIPAALYHFTVAVLGLEKAKRKVVWFVWLVSAIFLAVSLLTNVMFDRFYHYSWGIYLKFRPPAFLFILFFFAMTIGTLHLYWTEYRKSDRNTTRHRRAREFLAAFGIGYLGTLDFLPALGVPSYPIASVPMICMLILVSRAIWRYRLVDITPAFAAREIIDTMNDALIVVDPDRIVRLVNQATCGLLACQEQDLVGKRPVDGMPACRQLAEQIESIVGKSTVRHVEVECSLQDGAFRTFSMSASVMRNREGEPLATVCLLNDITDRRLAEKERERLIEQLQEANEKLQSIDKVKTNFISIASHELRTPLTTIKAFIELLLMKRGMPDERKVRLMSTINVETDRLSRLTADLLDLARIEAGSMNWAAGEVRLDEVITGVIASMQVLLENKSLRVSTEFSSPLPPVSCDRDRLIQVITNILSNAVKFSRPGDAVHIAVRQEDSPAQIVTEISDTGIGIPEKDLELIFEKFHRSEDERIAGIEGSGLGLAITRQIIEHYGGRIWATSAMGKGSMFTFTLPLSVQRTSLSLPKD